MILFTLFLMIFLIVTLIVLLLTGVVGTGFIIVFGDLIVFILIMSWILKKLFKRKKRK